jgi:hypothetical protein
MEKQKDGSYGFTPTENILLKRIGKLTSERTALLKRVREIDEYLVAHPKVFASIALERDVCGRCGGNLIVSTSGEASCLQCGRDATKLPQAVEKLLNGD